MSENLLSPQWTLAQIDRDTSRIDQGNGRSLEELLNSNDPLEGEEAQRLRNFATEHCIDFYELDPFGRALASGNLQFVQIDFLRRVARLLHTTTDSMEEAKSAAADEVAALRWGPNRTPVFDLILSGILMVRALHEAQLAVTRWLVRAAKVPVNGRDVTGCTALFHAITTQPAVELEFAQILYEAGSEVNQRNRYGYTPANEMCMIQDGRTLKGLQRTRDAMRWFLSHGGNLDIDDYEGHSARGLFAASRALWKHEPNSPVESVQKIIQKEDHRRKRLAGRCCALCGREPDAKTRLLDCARCNKIKYCASPRSCQALHWPKHKATCKSPEDLENEKARARRYVGIPDILVVG